MNPGKRANAASSAGELAVQRLPANKAAEGSACTCRSIGGLTAHADLLTAGNMADEQDSW